jgi:hypothetical protein
LILPERYCRISKAEEPFPETDPPDRQHCFHKGCTLYVKGPDGFVSVAENRPVYASLPNLKKDFDLMSSVNTETVTGGEGSCSLLVVG